MAIKDRLEKRGSGMRITLNASPFVPKANTPFQWLPMASQETLQNRLAILRNSLPLKGIKLNEESPAWSRVQGVLSRGDERVADALDRIEGVSLAEWHRVVQLLAVWMLIIMSIKGGTRSKSFPGAESIRE